MNDVKILPAKEDQWRIIQALNSQVYLADKDNDEDLIVDQPFTEGNIEYYKKLARGEYGHCAIAYLNDEPVGYIALAEIKFGHRKGKYLDVDNMGVDEEYRSKGVGTKLLEYAEEWAKSQGYEKLFVVAYWGNKQAINFYKKNDFYEIALQMEKKI